MVASILQMAWVYFVAAAAAAALLKDLEPLHRLSYRAFLA